MKLAYILSEAFALSQTFVFREILAVEAAGASVAIYALRKADREPLPVAAQKLAEQAFCIYPVNVKKLVRGQMHASWRHTRGYLCGITRAIYDALSVFPTRPLAGAKLLWHFLVAAMLVDEVKQHGAQHIHAHFAHSPASVAMYLSMISGIPYSFTAHANDIFVQGAALRQKVRRSAFAVCISEHGRSFLQSLGCPGKKLKTIHCGVDLTQFAWRERDRNTDRALGLVGVGRLVGKKGFHHLVDACGRLHQDGVSIRCTIAGEGPERPRLEKMIRERDLSETVHLIGAVEPNDIPKLLSNADIFVLPCVRSTEGDQDGIPVVPMEAMASGVPSISSRVSGIHELIRDGETGLLVEPGDRDALAKAIRTLSANEALRRKLSFAGRRTVEKKFCLSKSAQQLIEAVSSGVTEELRQT